MIGTIRTTVARRPGLRSTKTDAGNSPATDGSSRPRGPHFTDPRLPRTGARPIDRFGHVGGVSSARPRACAPSSLRRRPKQRRPARAARRWRRDDAPPSGSDPTSPFRVPEWRHVRVRPSEHHDRARRGVETRPVRVRARHVSAQHTLRSGLCIELERQVAHHRTISSGRHAHPEAVRSNDLVPKLDGPEREMVGDVHALALLRTHQTVRLRRT